MLVAIESGWVQATDSRIGLQVSTDRSKSKERIVVGVNEFRMDEEQKIPIHIADPSLEAAQIESLATRSGNRVTIEPFKQRSRISRGCARHHRI